MARLPDLGAYLKKLFETICKLNSAMDIISTILGEDHAAEVLILIAARDVNVRGLVTALTVRDHAKVVVGGLAIVRRVQFVAKSMSTLC